MADIKKSAAQLIGRTPLLEASNYAESQGIADVVLLAKLEYLNPAGSVKDRVALSMIEDAEKSGILKKGATIIEPTSGNTGIGLASVAAAKGYKAVFTLPETMSIERRKLLKAYGAKLVLTDGSKGMKGAIEKIDFYIGVIKRYRKELLKLSTLIVADAYFSTSTFVNGIKKEGFS